MPMSSSQLAALVDRARQKAPPAVSPPLPPRRRAADRRRSCASAPQESPEHSFQAPSWVI
jgi:hypothetical protein